MGDILSPRDEIFFFLFDPLDIVLVTKNDQGRYCQDNDCKKWIIAVQDPSSQRKKEDR